MSRDILSGERGEEIRPSYGPRGPFSLVHQRRRSRESRTSAAGADVIHAAGQSRGRNDAERECGAVSGQISRGGRAKWRKVDVDWV